jgi:hypothetical protein
MAKKTKQNSIDANFDFSSVEKASRFINPDKKVEKSIPKTVNFRLYIPTDLYKAYKGLMLEYAAHNEIFNLSNDRFFTNASLFVHSLFSEGNFFLQRPESFHSAIVRPGKRKRNDRYIAVKDAETLNFSVDESISNLYSSLIYSYIIKYDRDSLFDSKYSRVYFFYDFVRILQENKKAFFDYTV